MRPRYAWDWRRRPMMNTTDLGAVTLRLKVDAELSCSRWRLVADGSATWCEGERWRHLDKRAGGMAYDMSHMMGTRRWDSKVMS